MSHRRQRRAVTDRSSRRAAAPVPTTRHAALPLSVLAVIAVVVIVAAGVRVAAASGELWLDEIWSLRLAHLAPGPLGVFTALHHDNNHHLNTLYLRWLGDGAAWLSYRAHALVAGVGSIGLAAAVAGRSGPLEAAAASILIGGSFLMTLYASEARGYALAVFFALACVLAADRYLHRRRVVWAAAFSASAVLGILSHLTFLHALLGLGAWTFVRASSPEPAPRVWRTLGAMYAVPLLALAVLYWTDLRYVVIGGGPVLGTGEVVARVLSLSVGGPEDGPWRGVAAAVAVAAFGWSLMHMRRSRSDLWVLCLVAGGVAPMLTLLLVDGHLLYERYFLTAITFVLLSFSWGVAAVARRRPTVAVMLMAAYVVANAGHTSRLIARGRGAYISAMGVIARESTQRPATVGGDHDFRHGRVIDFLQPRVAGADDLEFHVQHEWAAAGPEWMLVHSQAPRFAPVPELSMGAGRRYALTAFYPSAGVSGWHLALYHNVLARR